MGILDHRKQWHFSVGAAGEQCLLALEQAMVHPGGLKLHVAKWEVKRGEVSRVPGGPLCPQVLLPTQGAGIIGEPTLE
jgi:hypothetical protein